ncbi:MAG TPA: hypothetical protein VFU35_13360 [Jatrophihabitans sp.]|nr:hypothetical protein [Jatrophihabitans sp.]
MLSTDDRLAPIRAALDASWTDELILDTGVSYRPDDPVRIRIRRRERRYDLTDDGTAVRLAGQTPGWLEVTERLVAAAGFNVNRRGILFVPAVEGRDIAALALRLADTSRATYLTLLELRADST